ncbi:hypothetical protein LguiB_012712 [Lonicera macranthoides]
MSQLSHEKKIRNYAAKRDFASDTYLLEIEKTEEHGKATCLLFLWQVSRCLHLKNSLKSKKEFWKITCSHYRRKCKIKAPCCGEIFDYRHCHNKAKWDCIALLDDVDSCDEAEFRMQIRHLALTKLPIARDQTARPKIEAILGDPQSEDQWGAFGLLDM